MLSYLAYTLSAQKLYFSNIIISADSVFLFCDMNHKASKQNSGQRFHGGQRYISKVLRKVANL